MKKRFTLIGLCLVLAAGMLMMTSCGDKMPYSSYDLDQYIKVANYKGLPVDKVVVKVTEQEVGDKINEMLTSATENKELKKGDEIKSGDTANIDYVGRINGKKFDGGSAKGTDLQIGSGTFITGFEDGLIGKTVGQKKIKLNLTFPEDYQSKDVAGKDVVFTVTINSATRPEKPEFNDEFAKKQGDYKNADELEAAVRKSLKADKKTEAENNAKTELWDKVVGKSKVKEYPKEELNHYMEFNSAQMDQIAKENSTTRNKVLSQYGFKSEKDFDTQNKESTKLRVKQELIIMKIAEDENLTYKDEDAEKLIAQFEQQGYDAEKIEQTTGRTPEEYAHIQLLYQEVMDFMYDNAKVVK